MTGYSYWLDVIKKSLLFLFSIFLVYIGFKISLFYIPFLIAFLLSLLIEPLIMFCMKKLKMRRKISAILIFTIILSLIIGLIVWGIVTLVTEASNFLNNINIYIDKVSDESQNLISKFNFDKIKLSDELTTILQNSSGDFIQTASSWVRSVVTKLLDVLTSLPTIGLYIVITILALYFMCTDKIYMLDQIEHHLPETWVKKITKHIKTVSKSLGCYLKAQLKLILISFLISVIGLYIFSISGMNVKYPLMIAIGIAIVDALPIFGSGTVMVPWAIISAFNGDIKLGVAILVLWIIMCVVRQIIEPKIVSGQIGIHPIFTLIAMYTGFRFLGFIGMFVGPIVLIILKNIYEVRIDRGFVKSIFEKECWETFRDTDKMFWGTLVKNSTNMLFFLPVSLKTSKLNLTFNITIIRWIDILIFGHTRFTNILNFNNRNITMIISFFNNTFSFNPGTIFKIIRISTFT